MWTGCVCVTLMCDRMLAGPLFATASGELVPDWALLPDWSVGLEAADGAQLGTLTLLPNNVCIRVRARIGACAHVHRSW